MKKSILIIVVLLIAIIAWQFFRPAPAKINVTEFYLAPGANGLISYQEFVDSTISITYAFNNDTIESEKMNRREFNKLIRKVYPGKSDSELVSTMQSLQVIIPK